MYSNTVCSSNNILEGGFRIIEKDMVHLGKPDMFKNILIPFSSEFYPKQVLNRSVFFSKKFNSKINLIYVIEEKTLEQAENLSESYITHYDMDETTKEIEKKQKQTADTIIFQDVKEMFDKNDISYDEKIVKGEFSDEVKKELKKNKYDLVLMGFEKECILDYRLLEELDTPIWIEAKSDSKTILAVCSNLAPNKKVPDVSIQLSKALGWNLNMLYVIDVEDAVEVDEKGIRSTPKKRNDLMVASEKFKEKMKEKNINVKIVKGSLENQTIKEADEINANLVIVGREQKKKGVMGFPVKNVKKRLVKKCKNSILFIN